MNKSSGLATTARIRGQGCESYCENQTVVAALMIRVDHLDQIIEVAGKLVSRVTRVGGETEFRRWLEKLASQCKREGLRNLSAGCESLGSFRDDMKKACESGQLPETMASEIAKLNEERAILLHEILAIKD